MRAGRDSRYNHRSRLGPGKETMPHQRQRYRPDPDPGLCVEYTLRAGSQYIQVLDTVVPASIGQQYTTATKCYYDRCRSRDIDTWSNDWHRV